MGSGIRKTLFGAVEGTGAQLDVRTIPFRPTAVELFNNDGLAVARWQESMADGSMLKQITAGTISLVTGGNGLTPLADGFRLGADTDMNVDGEVVYWKVYE